MITEEDLIKVGDLYFFGKEIKFLSEEIKYKENDIRYPHNCYLWSSAIQLNFEYDDFFYFVDICHIPDSHKISIRGWHKDYDAFRTVFDLPISLCSTVLGHFSGYDQRGSYLMDPLNDKFLPEDVEVGDIFKEIEDLIKVGFNTWEKKNG